MAVKRAIKSSIPVEATRSILGALRELGLSTYEAEAYLTLIRNPNISATQVCNEAGIPDSKVYFALEELQKKGLVLVSEGVPKHYRALPPGEALGKLKAMITQEYESQLEKLRQVTVALEPMYKRAEKDDVELAYVVKGFENVLRRIIDTLRNTQREAVLFIPELDIYDRLASHLLNLRRRGVKVKLALPSKLRRRVDVSRFSDVRELSSRCEDCWIVIVDGKTVISSSAWKTDRCHAILTQDPVLVAMSTEYYENPRCCA